ncbi:hypothetical protein ABPG74_005127 [Tetrahymena malaccensis]
MKQQHQQNHSRESKSLKNSYFISDYQDFENHDSSFELDEKQHKKKQPIQNKYPTKPDSMNLENQKLRSVSALENKYKQKRQKNKKLTFKIDLNKMKNPYKQALKVKNKNKSIFDDPEFSGIANTDINLYALHKQGVIDEENNQWGKLQKQLDEINPKPDINKVLDSLVTSKFSRPFQDFKIQKHLALPEYNQSEVNSRYRQNQVCELFEEDPEIDIYIEETKLLISQKKKQIEDNLKSGDSIKNKSQQERSNDDSSFSSDEFQENQFENGAKSKISNKKNEYILSEEEHKELFLLYCAKGHSPESACQQARVPIKCAKRWICNLTPSRLTGGGRKIIDGMLEQKLRLWILLKLYKELKIPSREQQIKYSLSQIKQNSFGCSKGWLEKYLDRNLLKFIVAHLRNLEIFRLEEVAKFFIVIPSVNSDLGQVQKEIKLVQNYQKHLELERAKQQNNDGGQNNFINDTKVKRIDLIIQPYIRDDQNSFFNQIMHSSKEKNNQNLELKHAQNKDSLSKAVSQGSSQQSLSINQVPLFNDKTGFSQFQTKHQTNNQRLHFQVPDWSPYLQMIERANAMKQLQHYLAQNNDSKNIEIQENQFLSMKAQIIDKLKQNTQISQETLTKFGNLYKFQEVQKFQEIQKQKQEKRQNSQMQIEMAQAEQEIHQKNDLKQTKPKFKKFNIENEEEEDEEEDDEDEDFQSKCKNEYQTKYDEREFYVDTKKPLPLHIRKLLKLSAINSRSDRLSQQPKNLDYYLKGCVFEIEAQNFFDVAVKTLNYKIESLIQVFKFRF